MIVRKTTPQEARRVNELFAICFQQPYSNCPIEDQETDEGTHWAAFDENGEMMSNFTIADYTIYFDGHTCKMGGIGGVATLPEHRRLGCIRACFAAALPDMYANGYEFSYLYPFSTAFYRKFGYECCVQHYGWEVDLSLLNPPKTGSTFRLAEKNRPMTEAIRAVDAVWEQRFNMMVQHRKEDYKWTLEADPAVKQEFTYVCFNTSGDPRAYCTFKPAPGGSRDLMCSRFCFADKEGFLGLMELFKTFSSDHGYVKFKTPVIPALQYLLPEWSLGGVKWNLFASAGMVRVINVKRVLEKAKYLGSGSVTLEIHDEQIPENNARFAVSFTDGKAAAVTQTQAEPDAVMTIPAFSALIAGVSDFAEAAFTFSGLKVQNPNPCLQQVFYRKPMMIVDYF